MTKVSVTLVLALTLAGAASSATRTSGLFGKTTREPAQPLCVEIRPCGGPARAALLVFTRANGESRSVRTDSRGEYRIALRPGRYKVRIGSRLLHSRPDPATVVVPRSGYRRVDFSIDSGIR